MTDGRAGIAAAGTTSSRRRARTGRCGSRRRGAPAADRADGAFLLGTFDELTVAHRDLRNVYADGRATNELLIRPIVVDGVTVGGWTRRLATGEVTIEVVLDAPLDERAMPRSPRRRSLRRVPRPARAADDPLKHRSGDRAVHPPRRQIRTCAMMCA